LGLRPRQNQSGERDPQLGISKAGNGYLRKLLVQCSNPIFGALWQTVTAQRMGLSAGWTRWRDCEEAGDCGGGTQAGSTVAPTLGKPNDLSAVLRENSGGGGASGVKESSQTQNQKTFC
jgi:hypothetical protein